MTKPSRSVPNRLALDIRPERRLHSTAFREFTSRIFVPSNRTASLPHPPSSECDASRKSRGMGRLRTGRSAASGVTAMRLQKVWEMATRKRLLDQLTHFSKVDGNSWSRIGQWIRLAAKALRIRMRPGSNRSIISRSGLGNQITHLDPRRQNYRRLGKKWRNAMLWLFLIVNVKKFCH